MYLLLHLASQRGGDDYAVSTVYDPVMDGQFTSVVEIRLEVLGTSRFSYGHPSMMVLPRLIKASSVAVALRTCACVYLPRDVLSHSV